jgi:hypothetical protein
MSSPCPYCGYDLSGLGEVGDSRLCPECGEVSRFVHIPPPWWLARPAKLLGAMLVAGFVAAALSIALALSGLGVFGFALPAIGVVVGTLGWCWYRVADFRARHGKSILPRSTLVHLAILAAIAVPLGYLFGWVVIGIAYLLMHPFGS